MRTIVNNLCRLENRPSLGRWAIAVRDVSPDEVLGLSARGLIHQERDRSQ